MGQSADIVLSHHFSNTVQEVWPGMVRDGKTDSAECRQLVDVLLVKKQKLTISERDDKFYLPMPW